MRDYDVRNNAAIDLSRRLDPSGWAAADSGSVLRRDLFETEYLRADGTPWGAQTLVTTPRKVYAPSFDAYPRWFVMSGQMTLAGQQPTLDDRVLLVFVRRDADDPWHMDSSVDFPVDEPDALGAGTASNASPAEIRAAIDALKGVQAYVTSGVPTTVQPDAQLHDVRHEHDGRTRSGDAPRPERRRAARKHGRPHGSVRIGAGGRGRGWRARRAHLRVPPDL